LSLFVLSFLLFASFCDCRRRPKMSSDTVMSEENKQGVITRIRTTLTDTPAFTVSDSKIFRFYRGRFDNEEKASKALIRHEQWRIENDVDNLGSNKVRFEKEIASGKGIIGERLDINSRPVLYVIARRHDGSTRVLEELKLLIIYSFEKALEMSKPEEEKITICFDLSEFSLNNMDYEAVKTLIDLLAYNYPDILGNTLVVDSPFFFWACWAVIKPWIDAEAAAKVTFVSKAELTLHIPKENIIPDLLPNGGQEL
jgi:hypothetical protein